MKRVEGGIRRGFSPGAKPASCQKTLCVSCLEETLRIIRPIGGEGLGAVSAVAELSHCHEMRFIIERELGVVKYRLASCQYSASRLFFFCLCFHLKENYSLVSFVGLGDQILSKR